jgi:hypothetical protein
MLNRKMQSKLDSRECIDVMHIGCRAEEAGVYILRSFIEDIDYCDAEREAWIWSIGKNRETGEIRAATDARFYEDPEWQCIWLR